MKNNKRITNFYKLSGEEFLSCYGFVTWAAWMKAEIMSMEKIGRKARIVEEKKKGKPTGRFALERVG